MQRFQSILQFKKVSCKNCYKCVRNCPVKAIRVHDHQARIIESQCIYCEKCILVCPQDAKEEQNMIPVIRSAMESGKQVIASLHPAYLARFGVTGISKLCQAMKLLGFTDVADASEGASLMAVQNTFAGTEGTGNRDIFCLSCDHTIGEEALSTSSGESDSVCLYDAVSCQLSQKEISGCRDRLYKSLYFSHVRAERTGK